MARRNVKMMNDALKEQISAYVDGELSEAESALLVRRLSQDAELRSVAAEYLAVGRAIRGDAGPVDLGSLRGRIAGELDTETSADVAEPEVAVNGWLRPVAGIGIAAAVAMVTLLGLQTVGDTPAPVDTLVSNDRDAVAIDEAPLYTEPPVADALSDQPNEMLTRYYQQHHDRAADIGSSGIMGRLVELELRDTRLRSSDDEEPDDETSADDAAVE